MFLATTSIVRPSSSVGLNSTTPRSRRRGSGCAQANSVRVPGLKHLLGATELRKATFPLIT